MIADRIDLLKVIDRVWTCPWLCSDIDVEVKRSVISDILLVAWPTSGVY